MWKSLLPGERVILGDTIRYRPSTLNLSYKEIAYQVVKTELHYFEVIEKTDTGKPGEEPARKVIKYMDIGYHLGIEVWDSGKS